MVIVGCRDFLDSNDVFLAFDADTGAPRWRYEYPAPGRLDYGNSPRSTPLITTEQTYTYGAFGHLCALETQTGQLLWTRDLQSELAVPELPWGLTGSPLLVDDKLIVQAGGHIANVVALEPETGALIWQSEGGKPGHASFIVSQRGPNGQAIGYDAVSLGGWDLATGARLWSIRPKLSGDFNVPTPVLLSPQRLLVATENNGARIYEIDELGIAAPKPVATYEDLLPDSHTPVASGDRIYGLSNGLRCLDANTLKEIWVDDSDPFHRYGSLIASGRTLLLLNQDSLLLLLEDEGDRCRELGRLSLSDNGQETLSHPAIAGKRLYVRIGTTLACLEL